nr:ComEC/Rec2 family competence protein [Mycoplasmopsis lipofaciens]
MIKSENHYFIVSNNKNNILVFTNDFVSKQKIYLNQYVEIKAKILNVNDINNINKQWLLSNSVSYILKNATVETIYRNNFSIYYEIIKYGEKFSKIFEKYWSLIVFGYKNNSIDILKKTNNLNITHLIAISGFHFDILIFCLNSTLNFFVKNKKISKAILYLFCFLYLTLLFQHISALRAFIMLLIKENNNKQLWKYYDSIFLSIIILFLINFNSIFSFSFIISFLSIFFIKSINLILKKLTIKKLWKSLILILFIYIYNIPIIILLNSSVNIVGIIYSIFYIPIFEFTYIVSILVFWSPDFLKYIYYFIDLLMNFSDKFSYYIYFTKMINIWTLITWNIIWYLSFYFLYTNKIKKQQKLLI